MLTRFIFTYILKSTNATVFIGCKFIGGNMKKVYHEDCGCGCGCGHDHDHDLENEEIETMVLTLEDDTEL